MKNLLRKIRTILRAAVGADVLVRRDVRVPMSRFGSEYGGWDVATEGIDEHSIVYSVGVGTDASFDMELIDALGVTVHAFDPTPKSIAWVKEQHFPDGFILHEFGMAERDGEVSFFPPENPEHVSYTVLERASARPDVITVPVKRLKTIMEELGHDRLDILKMDIEGAEYGVLSDLIESGIRPKQILVEFHHRFPGVTVLTTKQAIRILRSAGYRLFSISATNEEFGFLYSTN